MRIDDLIESANLGPYIEDAPEGNGMKIYRRYGVVAYFTYGRLDHRSHITIYEFSSTLGGMGNARAALTDLSHQNTITVLDPGEPNSPSFEFWRRMGQEGLVWRLLDEDYRVLEMFHHT